MIRTMTMQQTVDYLDGATITFTHKTRHAITHIGTNASGQSFVLLNDYSGQTLVAESD